MFSENGMVTDHHLSGQEIYRQLIPFL